jgi:hypothetical protein
MRRTAATDPVKAENFLQHISPNKHEVCTHIWLETIAANGRHLGHMFPLVFDSVHLFDAGWHGADWKSFADAAKATIPFLQNSDLERLFQLILAFNPEQQFASKLLKQVREEGEEPPWRTSRSAIYYLNRSGHEQWSVLETIGETLLSAPLKDRLDQLRRKFRGAEISEPDNLEAHWVGSPIKRNHAAHMTDDQWLRAIERYNNDEDRRRGKTFVNGGASQLAGELQHLAKEQPARFVDLLEQIPDAANNSYVSHLLWGLAEADHLDDEILRRAVFNAHNRPKRPFGMDIARLIGKQPAVATDPAILAVLVWYIEHGEANSEETGGSSDSENELTTIEDLLSKTDGVHVRGMNGTRGWSVEILGNILWHVPEAIEEAWRVLERRAIEEPLISVRCCMMRPAVPLFNDSRERCAALAERLSRPPAGTVTNVPPLSEKAWLSLAFPSEQLPQFLKRISVWGAVQIERFVRRRHQPRGEPKPKWWSPLLTHSGVQLLPFLLRSVPATGKRLIYRLVVSGDDMSRMIGAWHVFRQSFQDALCAPLADTLGNHGVVYRRLLADIASHAVTVDEYRYRAEKVLQSSFNDADKRVRSQAADVFRNIAPDDFIRYKGLANYYLNSKAFEAESWAFFHALGEAKCKVDDIVVPATEKLIDDIKRNGDAAGRRSGELHDLQDIIKNEYSSSEGDPTLRRRLLDLIDNMLQLELYGVDTIIRAHER